MRSDHMNAAATRTAGTYLVAWGAILLFVVLLSFIFTILGTITCAVLAGMMIGAFKDARWFSVSVSLVFPAVIFGMVRSGKVELAQPQAILLGALCFSAFWVTYLVSALVLFCEQRERKSSMLPAPVPPPETLAAAGHAAATSCASAAEPLGSILPLAPSCLKQLQGNWVYAAASAGEPPYQKIIQIREAKLELMAIDATGRMSLLARGDVTLQNSRPPPQALVIPEADGDPADFLGCP
jgi:hypothetical protein